VRLAKLRRPKIVCSPSYADFESRAKCSNVVGLGPHDKGRAHIGDIVIGRKPKTLKAFDVSTPEELIQKP
jgi:hypothetical protein